jgi:hypothetical protein
MGTSRMVTTQQLAQADIKIMYNKELRPANKRNNPLDADHDAPKTYLCRWGPFSSLRPFQGHPGRPGKISLCAKTFVEFPCVRAKVSTT